MTQHVSQFLHVKESRLAESRLINQIQFLSTTKLWVELTEWTKTLAHI